MTRSDVPWSAITRLIGNEGMIEASLSDHALRVWGKGQSGWQEIEVPGGQASDLEEPIRLGVLDLIDALKTGREPELSGRKALQATELIFATYESSRRRGRVELPLTIDDSPFLEIIQ
jgi:predicted dehydrogenase